MSVVLDIVGLLVLANAFVLLMGWAKANPRRSTAGNAVGRGSTSAGAQLQGARATRHTSSEAHYDDGVNVRSHCVEREQE